MTTRPDRQQGVTLVELILSMVIISVAVTGVLTIFTFSTRYSADPIIQQQTIAVAEAYMDEILLQAYSDPNGTNAGETRATYDNVADYNGLSDTGATDQQGNLISNLSQYNVTVAVAAPVSLADSIPALPVTVTVSVPNVITLALVGYKFNY